VQARERLSSITYAGPTRRRVLVARVRSGKQGPLPRSPRGRGGQRPRRRRRGTWSACRARAGKRRARDPFPRRPRTTARTPSESSKGARRVRRVCPDQPCRQSGATLAALTRTDRASRVERHVSDRGGGGFFHSPTIRSTAAGASGDPAAPRNHVRRFRNGKSQPFRRPGPLRRGPGTARAVTGKAGGD